MSVKHFLEFSFKNKSNKQIPDYIKNTDTTSLIVRSKNNTMIEYHFDELLSGAFSIHKDEITSDVMSNKISNAFLTRFCYLISGSENEMYSYFLNTIVNYLEAFNLNEFNFHVLHQKIMPEYLSDSNSPFMKKFIKSFIYQFNVLNQFSEKDVIIVIEICLEYMYTGNLNHDKISLVKCENAYAVYDSVYYIDNVYEAYRNLQKRNDYFDDMNELQKNMLQAIPTIFFEYEKKLDNVPSVYDTIVELDDYQQYFPQIFVKMPYTFFKKQDLHIVANNENYIIFRDVHKNFIVKSLESFVNDCFTRYEITNEIVMYTTITSLIKNTPYENYIPKLYGFSKDYIITKQRNIEISQNMNYYSTIFIEYIDGYSLHDYAKLVSEKQNIRILIQILSFLNKLYKETKFTHYDLHSKNIIIAKKEPHTLKIGDYDLVIEDGMTPIIFDFGRSRLEKDGKFIGRYFNNFEQSYIHINPRYFNMYHDVTKVLAGIHSRKRVEVIEKIFEKFYGSSYEDLRKTYGYSFFSVPRHDFDFELEDVIEFLVHEYKNF